MYQKSLKSEKGISIFTSGIRLFVHQQEALYHMNIVLRIRPRIRQSVCPLFIPPVNLLLLGSGHEY